MKIFYQSNKKPVMLKFGVKTSSPQKIHLRVYDPKKDNTVYTDRYNVFSGTQNFYVRMPLSPMLSVVEIYNERNRDLPKGKDNSFQVIEQKALPLPVKPEAMSGMNPLLPEFLKFAKEFCENAGWLSTGTYYSDDGHFCFEYLDVIRDKNGNPLATPARVSTVTGIIQISQFHFKTYTVPKRFAIVDHEYSHFYENNNQRDEVEADLNGLLIYLGEGFPRIEAHQAFLDVFKNSPSDLNRHRYNVLFKFINKFDNIDFLQEVNK